MGIYCHPDYPCLGSFVLILKDSSGDLFGYFVIHIGTIVNVYHHVKYIFNIAVFAAASLFCSIHVCMFIDIFCYLVEPACWDIILFTHFKHFAIIFCASSCIPIVFYAHISEFVCVNFFDFFNYHVVTCPFVLGGLGWYWFVDWCLGRVVCLTL